MLYGLYEGSTESDHASIVNAYFGEIGTEYLLPAVVFVAERSATELCGFLELSVRDYAEGCFGPAPYVESWYVDEDVRESGTGRKLIEAAEQWALANGYRELASDAELSNAASQAAHKALGFEEVERAVHFRKKLEPSP